MELHKQGYSYVGPNSLYKLSWWEIWRLEDSIRISTKIREEMRKMRSSNLNTKQQNYLNKRFNKWRKEKNLK